MSEEEAKARRRMQAAQKRSEARQKRQRATEMTDQKKTLDEKIQKLEEAKADLSVQIANTFSFSGSLASKLKDIDQGSFRGDRRRKYDRKVGDISKELSKIVEKHQKNQQTIDAKLANLKTQSQELGSSISMLNHSISVLEAAAARLSV